MTLNLMLGVASGVLHPAQGCKILVLLYYNNNNNLAVLEGGDARVEGGSPLDLE